MTKNFNAKGAESFFAKLAKRSQTPIIAHFAKISVISYITLFNILIISAYFCQPEAPFESNEMRFLFVPSKNL